MIEKSTKTINKQFKNGRIPSKKNIKDVINNAS